MSTNSEWVWYVAQFEDADDWDGPFLTRDEAVSSGLEAAREVGSETIYLAECRGPIGETDDGTSFALPDECRRFEEVEVPPAAGGAHE